MGPEKAGAVRPQRCPQQPLCCERSDFPPPSQATSSLQVRCDCVLRAPPSGSVGPSDPRHSLLEEQGPVLASGPSLTSLGTPSLTCPSGIG